MNHRQRIMSVILLTALLLLTLTACDGEGGSATGQTQNCRSSAEAGACKGSYRTIKGRYTYRIEDLLVPRGTPVRVLAQVDVEEGALRVALTGPEGEVVEAVARPGEPVSIEGLAVQDEFESVPVILEVVEGEVAHGVTYAIAWEVE